MSCVACVQKKELAAVVEFLGADSPGVVDIQKLFDLAEAYGIADWLVFDASVVRGLSYYTGARARVT